MSAKSQSAIPRPFSDTWPSRLHRPFDLDDTVKGREHESEGRRSLVSAFRPGDASHSTGLLRLPASATEPAS